MFKNIHSNNNTNSIKTSPILRPKQTEITPKRQSLQLKFNNLDIKTPNILDIYVTFK